LCAIEIAICLTESCQLSDAIIAGIRRLPALSMLSLVVALSGLSRRKNMSLHPTRLR
jgi:hypothetical protein